MKTKIRVPRKLKKKLKKSAWNGFKIKVNCSLNESWGNKYIFDIATTIK